MKKNILLINSLLLAVIAPVFGQDKINNIRTAKYVDIPGMKFSIIPPDTSFKVTTSEILGLVSENYKCNIDVSDGPFFFTYEDARAQRMEEAKNGSVEVINDLEINGYQAFISKMKIPPPATGENKFWEGDDAMIFFTIIGSKDQVRWSVTATYLSSMDSLLSGSLVQSFRSIIYDNERVVNPFDAQIFELTTDNTPFKYVSQSPSRGICFNLFGRQLTTKERKDFVVVVLTKQTIQTEIRKGHVTDKALKFWSKETLGEINEIEQAGLSGYEAIGYGNDHNNQPAMRYVVVLFDNDRYIEFSGYAQSDFDERTIQFRTMLKTLKLKN